MKLSEFNVLPEKEKMHILWLDGNFIADRKASNHSIVLYQLFSFYVELWYPDYLNELDILCAFTNTDHLEPYLNSIDIAALIA